MERRSRLHCHRGGHPQILCPSSAAKRRNETDALEAVTALQASVQAVLATFDKDYRETKRI